MVQQKGNSPSLPVTLTENQWGAERLWVGFNFTILKRAFRVNTSKWPGVATNDEQLEQAMAQLPETSGSYQ